MTFMARAACLLFALPCALVAMPGCADSQGESAVTGDWGGDHIRLTLTESGGRVEYDCAAGTIDAPLRPDREGNFEAHGTHVFERGGPVLQGQPPPRQHAARYSGWTNGTDMRLTVTLPDKGKDFGTFSLRKGRPALLDKCV